ncbi:hypothetical protein BJV77DRAFT_1035070 [Russula vinacea]|nr:hypothetical protein BJV77DRAFT_1035070 [Russula vinacea]
MALGYWKEVVLRTLKGGGSLVSSGVKLLVGTRRSQPATSASCGRYDPLFAALVFLGSLLYRLLWLSGYSIPCLRVIYPTFTPFLDARQNAGHYADLLFPNQIDVWSSEAGSTQHYYPYPSIPASFHSHCRHDLLKSRLVEDFVTPNAPPNPSYMAP